MTTNDENRQPPTPAESFYFPELAQPASQPSTGDLLQVKPALQPSSQVTQASQQQIAQQQAMRQQSQMHTAQQRAIRQQQEAVRQAAQRQAVQQQAAQQQVQAAKQVAAQQQAVQKQAALQQAAQQRPVQQQAAVQQQAVQQQASQQQAKVQATQQVAQRQVQDAQQVQPAQQAQQQSYQAAPSAQQPQAAYYADRPYVAAPPVQPTIVQKKSRGWVVAVVFIVCMFAFTAFCVKSCGDAIAQLGSSAAPKALTGDTVAIIDLDGTIQYDGSACSPEGFKELLDEAETNSHIKALVIRVNSGGGTATAGEEMSEYLKDFSKPVVVSSASINASAAYMISAQADYIFVARSTEIGAIGTAMQLTDISGLLDMLGVEMETITSADSKDSSYGYRPLTDEERAYYQDMVNKINNMFIQEVMDGRHMTEEQVRAIATGMPFTGDDAIKNGLADAVGTREDACDKAAALAGISSYGTTELYIKDYDLSSLSGLLGQTNYSVKDLARLANLASRAGLQ